MENRLASHTCTLHAGQWDHMGSVCGQDKLVEEALVLGSKACPSANSGNDASCSKPTVKFPVQWEAVMLRTLKFGVIFQFES